jgi:hypothetical protein
MSDKESRAPVSTVALADGRQAVVGQTYGAQIVMRAYHGTYDGSLKMWVFPSAEVASAAAAECVRLFNRAKQTPPAAPAA